MTFFDLCGTACCEDDLQLMDYIKGVRTRRTRLGVEVVRVHYTAHPERDSEWAKLKRRKYSSQAAWDREQHTSNHSNRPIGTDVEPIPCLSPAGKVNVTVLGRRIIFVEHNVDESLIRHFGVERHFV